MEAKNLYVLSGTEDFMLGELDNVTLQNGRIILDNVAGQHVLYGCYTSPAISLPEFDALVMSWNASTPEGTVVDAQARVLVDGNWTMWSSFGKWSPFLTTRANAKRPQRGPVCVEENILRLDSKTALQAQLRIYLYTEDARRSPAVRLLAASVHPVNPALVAGTGRPLQRVLRVPAYSQVLRDPEFGGAMSLPVSMAGLMNRFGEDVLPEELAHAMYDWADRSCSCLNFAAAAAGCWGYESLALWLDLAHLRDEVRAGNAVTVRVSYPRPDKALIPPIQRDMGEADGHYVTVTGFTVENGGNTVLLNDPLAPDDSTVACHWSLDYFLAAWDGLALLLHRRARDAGWDKPQRTAVTLCPDPNGEENLYLMIKDGKPLRLPSDFCGSDGVPKGTLAVVKNDSVVHATTAHKHFRFVSPHSGGVILEKQPDAKTRYSVYAIDAAGRMLVGEVTI